MSRTQVKYEFGRLNLLPHVTSANKPAFLMQGLASGVVDDFHGNLWTFLEVTREEIESVDYIVGFLVKYELTESKPVVDTERRRISSEMLENAIRAQSRFVLHLPSLIIAFHLVAPEITRGIFIERFTSLFSTGHGNFFVQADIQLIQDERLVLEALRRFDAITRVSIFLHPSNPGNRERWRVVDEHLKKVNAAGYREEYVAAKLQPGDAGIKAAGDPDIEGKISMAQDGYGDAKVTGIVDGKVQTFTTKRNPITAMAPRDEAAPNRTIVETLHTAVQKVLERFK